MQIRACHYIEDHDVMTVIFADGTMRCLHCAEVEVTLNMHMVARSRLMWLKENEPYFYAEWVIHDDVKHYAAEYSREYLQQQNALADQLAAHYQDRAHAEAYCKRDYA